MKEKNRRKENVIDTLSTIRMFLKSILTEGKKLFFKSSRALDERKIFVHYN